MLRAESFDAIALAVRRRCAADARRRGGDLVDVVWRSDGSCSLLLADLSSKGAAGAAHASMVRRVFRHRACNEGRPSLLLARLNALLCLANGCADDVTFAPAIVATFEPHAAWFAFASAGHDAALIVRSRAHEHLAPTGVVLGVLDDAVYQETLVPLGGRDVFVAATDGFTECPGTTGERRFGTSGIAGSAARSERQTPGAVARAVVGAADRFGGGRYHDDATIVAVGLGG